MEPDADAASGEQLERFVQRARRTLSVGDSVVVHCSAGRGRTGTVLAAYLVGEGMTPQQAIARVRQRRPGSIETPEQEAAIHRFAAAGSGGLLGA